MHAQWELHMTQLGDGKIDETPKDPDNTDFLCSQFVCGSIDFAGRALAQDVQGHA